jgi:hypothetical protein
MNVANHERLMLRTLCAFGMPEGELRPDAWVLSKELTDQGEKAKYQAWTCESLLYAMREIGLGDRCNWRVVVRCYGQAREYKGRTGGFVVNCHVNDALADLQRAIEDRVVGQ